MARHFRITSLLIVCAGLMTAQLRTVKPVSSHPKRTTLAVGAGVSRSVVYLSRNVKENNDATGFNITAVYGGARLTRFSAEYTFYKVKNIEPTWYDIHASSLEANVHFLARFKSRKALFYPLFGLSYNVFSGYFTGQNDFLQLGKIYAPNRRAVSSWVGLNVGTGYEYFFRPGSFFVDYKMRVGMTEGRNQLNIMDVCFSAGLRFNMRVPSIYTIFRGTRGRYFVDDENDGW